MRKLASASHRNPNLKIAGFSEQGFCGSKTARLQLTATPTIHVPNGSFPLSGNYKAFMLVYLHRRDDWVSTEALGEKFYTDTDPAEQQRRNVRNLIKRLNADLAKWDVLLIEFNAGSRHVRWPIATSDVQTLLDTEDPATAYHARQGEYLQGFTLDRRDTRIKELQGIHLWLEEDRHFVEKQWQVKSKLYAEELAANGNKAKAAQVILNLLRVDPYDEDLRRSFRSYTGSDFTPPASAYL